jgi:orotate phosphoribosyltransferase
VYDRERLAALIREQALEFGNFTLASGKQASFYLDCRRVTLDSAGARLIGEGMLELLADDWPDAVGGMAIGADPITAAILTVASLCARKRRSTARGGWWRGRCEKEIAWSLLRTW